MESPCQIESGLPVLNGGIIGPSNSMEDAGTWENNELAKFSKTCEKTKDDKQERGNKTILECSSPLLEAYAAVINSPSTIQDF